MPNKYNSFVSENKRYFAPEKQSSPNVYSTKSKPTTGEWLNMNSQKESLYKKSAPTSVNNAKATFKNNRSRPSLKYKKILDRVSKGEFKSRVIPSAIAKPKGLRAKLAMGAISMLNVGVMKAIGKQSVGMFERFMQDGAVGRNMLNAARIGGKAAVGIGIGMGTVGLANALSANRHGRGS